MTKGRPQDTLASGHAWLDAALAEARMGGPAPQQALSGVSDELLVPILRACVERMPELRGTRGSEPWQIGVWLYDTAVALYSRRLRFGEDDLCALLQASRHTCGHGSDVEPPIDLAIRHARDHGLSPELAAAVREFLTGLKGLPAQTAKFAQRRAAMLLVLSENADPARPCWSDSFRQAIAELPEERRRAWQNVALTMALNDRAESGASWRKQARAQLERLGADEVVRFCASCWPGRAASTCVTVQTAGTHVLKNLLWLLALVAAAAPPQAPACDALVAELAELQWKPLDRAMKVLVAAALYFGERPAAVARAPLERLLARARSAPPSSGYGHEASCARIEAALAGLDWNG